MHNNLSYHYSCGYYVYCTEWQYHPNTRKRTHIPNVGRDEAHTIAVASMKAQHKTLPDGSGTGKGWILAQQLIKSNWVMDRQYTWKQQHQQQQWRGWQLGETGPRSGTIDKKNIRPTTVNSFYPTTNTSTNRFLLLATNDDNDNKKIITNSRTHKNMETAFSTPAIQLSKQEAILDTGDTGHFVLPGKPVKMYNHLAHLSPSISQTDQN